MLTNLLLASKHFSTLRFAWWNPKIWPNLFFDFEKLSKSCDWWPYGFSQFLSCMWQHHYKLTDLKRKLRPDKSNKTSLKNPIKQLFKWWLDVDMVFAVDKLPVLVPNAFPVEILPTNTFTHSYHSLYLLHFNSNVCTENVEKYKVFNYISLGTSALNFQLANALNIVNALSKILK